MKKFPTKAEQRYVTNWAMKEMGFVKVKKKSAKMWGVFMDRDKFMPRLVVRTKVGANSWLSPDRTEKVRPVTVTWEE